MRITGLGLGNYFWSCIVPLLHPLDPQVLHVSLTISSQPSVLLSPWMSSSISKVTKTSAFSYLAAIQISSSITLPVHFLYPFLYCSVCWIYQFSLAACCRNKLPQNICQKSDICLTRLTSRGWECCILFCRHWVGFIPCLSQLLDAAHIPWLLTFLLHLQSQQRQSSFSHITSLISSAFSFHL